MSNFVQRCKDIDFQNWHDRINTSYFLKTYSSYKLLFETEKYLLHLSEHNDLLRIYCKFWRLSHNLAVQKSRFNPAINLTLCVQSLT